MFWNTARNTRMDATTNDISTCTPVRVNGVDSEITFAPRKGRDPNGFGCFNPHVAVALRYEWPLTGGRIGGYIFDNVERCVTLYTVDTPGTIFTNDMTHVSYNAEDWKTARTKIWKDLGVSRVDGAKAFKNIDTLFKWCLLEDRYNGVKMRLF